MKHLLLLLLLLLAEATFSQTQLLPESDEFNRICSMQDWLHVNDTEGWNASHLRVIDIDQTNPDHLTIIPYTTAWYANYRSNLMFKEVSGNFAYTIHVHATDTTGNNIPGSAYSLTGAMVRTATDLTTGSQGWVPGQENYVFLSLGFAAGGTGPHFEVKTTTNSASSLEVIPITVAEAKIKLIRIDNAIIALYQLPGENWQFRRRYDRGDMPDTLQVGNVAYTDWNKVNTYTHAFHNGHVINAELDPDPSSNPSQPFVPNIIGNFDYGRFESIEIPIEYQGLDFSDPNDVSETEILSLFGYEPPSTDLQGWKIWKGTNSNFTDPTNWSGGTVPTSMDSLLIPNCNCPELTFPMISSGSHTYQSLVIEDGGQLSIAVGATLHIDLTGNEARFHNQGTILNTGLLELVNSSGKTIANTGIIETSGIGEFHVLE